MQFVPKIKLKNAVNISLDNKDTIQNSKNCIYIGTCFRELSSVGKGHCIIYIGGRGSNLYYPTYPL
jgi:hypothetical protein